MKFIQFNIIFVAKKKRGKIKNVCQNLKTINNVTFDSEANNTS